MSAAANAAGFLYAHGRLPVSDLDGQMDTQTPRRAAEPRFSGRLEPKVALWQGPSQPVKQVRAPRIEYRKRRFYALPSAA